MSQPSKFNHFFRYLVGLFVCVIFVTLSTWSGEHIFYRIMPYSHWFEYTKVESRDASYPINSPFIAMQSYSKWNFDLKASWVDSLHCDFNEQRTSVFIGSQETSGTITEADNTQWPVSWRLNIKAPDEAATCRVRSGVTVVVGGIEKRQIIWSNNFKITAQPDKQE